MYIRYFIFTLTFILTLYLSPVRRMYLSPFCPYDLSTHLLPLPFTQSEMGYVPTVISTSYSIFPFPQKIWRMSKWLPFYGQISPFMCKWAKQRPYSLSRAPFDLVNDFYLLLFLAKRSLAIRLQKTNLEALSYWDDGLSARRNKSGELLRRISWCYFESIICSYSDLYDQRLITISSTSYNFWQRWIWSFYVKMAYSSSVGYHDKYLHNKISI